MSLDMTSGVGLTDQKTVHHAHCLIRLGRRGQILLGKCFDVGPLEMKLPVFCIFNGVDFLARIEFGPIFKAQLRSSNYIRARMV